MRDFFFLLQRNIFAINQIDLFVISKKDSRSLDHVKKEFFSPRSHHQRDQWNIFSDLWLALTHQKKSRKCFSVTVIVPRRAARWEVIRFFRFVAADRRSMNCGLICRVMISYQCGDLPWYFHGYFNIGNYSRGKNVKQIWSYHYLWSVKHESLFGTRRRKRLEAA